MGLTERLVGWQRIPALGRIASEILSLYGVEIPRDVKIGDGLTLHHRGQGVIVTPKTRIGRDVVIFQQVTIGRSGIGQTDEAHGFEGIDIGDGAVLCAGAKVLGGRGVLRVGAGTVIAANAVLTRSTGENEVWGGIPARKLSERGSPAARGRA